MSEPNEGDGAVTLHVGILEVCAVIALVILLLWAFGLVPA